jgi:hypothetical protein
MPGESAARELHEDTGHQHSPGLLRHLRHQPGRAPSLAPPESRKPMDK